MTKGEMKLMGQLILDTGEFVSVGSLHMILGYSRRFVEKTMLKLYWDPPKGMFLVRMYKSDVGDWFYRYGNKE